MIEPRMFSQSRGRVPCDGGDPSVAGGGGAPAMPRYVGSRGREGGALSVAGDWGEPEALYSALGVEGRATVRSIGLGGTGVGPQGPVCMAFLGYVGGDLWGVCGGGWSSDRRSGGAPRAAADTRSRCAVSSWVPWVGPYAGTDVCGGASPVGRSEAMRVVRGVSAEGGTGRGVDRCGRVNR